MTKPKIGNEDSALARVFKFIDDVRRMCGTEPQEIVLFAEDFDAINFETQPQPLRKYKITRGPSIIEYQAALGSRHE